jgi:hypothetical protein
MVFVRGVVDGAAENIQQTSIDPGPGLSAPLSVHLFRVLSFQVFNPPDAKLPEVLRNALPYARNLRQFLQTTVL